MSSKKQLSPKKSTPEKKSTISKSKKTVTAKKAASGKAVSAKRPAAAKKTPAKPAKKAASAAKVAKTSPQKAAPKKAAPKKTAPSKTVSKAAKPVKSAKKAPAKAVKAKPAVPAKKAKPVASGSPKESKAKPASQKIGKTVAKKEPVKTPAKKKEDSTPKTVPPKLVVPQQLPVDRTSTEKEKFVKSGTVSVTAELLKGGVKLSKVAFFFEDLELDDHASKKKISPDAVEKPTASKRRRASVGEETTEEIYARVIAELQEANARVLQECENQLCTKCCKNPVALQFRVDKDLGYCEECAEILGLGHSKEMRHLNYQQGLLGADSLDEARDDDDFGEAPSEQDLETSDSLLEDETI